MAKIDDGGPAFLVMMPHMNMGMSLRDYFAGKALCEYLAAHMADDKQVDEDVVADCAYSDGRRHAPRPRRPVPCRDQLRASSRTRQAAVADRGAEMTLQKITIARAGWNRETIHDEIDAHVIGCFAVHPDVGFGTTGYTLTHVPTGFVYLSGVTERKAKAAAREILNGPLDWTLVAAPSDLTDAHKAQGKAMRGKYMGGR